MPAATVSRPAAAPVPQMAMSIDDAAKSIGVSVRTLWTLAKKGDVKSIKIGARRLFRPGDLADFLASRAS